MKTIKKIKLFYYKNIKKYEYFTITKDGKIVSYIFEKRG